MSELSELVELILPNDRISGTVVKVFSNTVNVRTKEGIISVASNALNLSNGEKVYIKDGIVFKFISNPSTIKRYIV